MNVNTFRATLANKGGPSFASRYRVTIISPVLSSVAQNLGNFFTLGSGSQSLLTRLQQAGKGLGSEALISRYFGEFLIDPVGETKSLEILCDRASLPGIAFNTTESRIYGPVNKNAFDTTFENISLSFICSASMKERYFFEAWMAMVKDQITNDFNFPSEYTTTILIRQFSLTDEFTYGVRLAEAYPVALNASDLNYEGDNITLRVTVQIAYLQWKNIKSFDTYVQEAGKISQGLDFLKSGTSLTF